MATEGAGQTLLSAGSADFLVANRDLRGQQAYFTAYWELRNHPQPRLQNAPP